MRIDRPRVWDGFTKNTRSIGRERRTNMAKAPLEGNRKLVLAITAIIGVVASALVGDLETADALTGVLTLVLAYFGANVGEHAAKRNQAK